MSRITKGEVALIVASLLGIAAMGLDVNERTIRHVEQEIESNDDHSIDINNSYGEEENEQYGVLLDGDKAVVLNLTQCAIGRIDDECDTLVIYTYDGDIVESVSNTVTIIPGAKSATEAYEQALSYGYNSDTIEVLIPQYDDAKTLKLN